MFSDLKLSPDSDIHTPHIFTQPTVTSHLGKRSVEEKKTSTTAEETCKLPTPINK